MLYGNFGIAFPLTTFLAIGWEIIERRLKELRPDLFPHPSQDTPVNALFDVAAVILGRTLFAR